MSIIATHSDQVSSFVNNTDQMINTKGRSALHNAAENGTKEEVALQLSLGAVDACDTDGFSALHYAARRGDKAIYDLIRLKGANCALLDNNANTTLLVSEQHGHSELYKHIKKQDRRVCIYSKELRLRKHLAHLFNIAGTTTLMPPDLTKKEPVTIGLEGWWGSIFWKIIRKRTVQFFKVHPNAVSATAIGVCEIVIDKLSKTPQNLYNRFNKEKKPIIIRTGYQKHFSSVLIWGAFFVCCDRGAKRPFEVVYIDRTKINESFFTDLLSLNKQARDGYRTFFKEKMKNYLLPQQHISASELTRLMFLPNQEIGNCSWANSEAAMYALFVLHGVMCNAGLPTNEQLPLTEICSRQKGLFNSWQAFMIQSEVEKYINSHLTLERIVPELQTFYCPPDWQLLDKVQNKASEKLALYIGSFKTIYCLANG